MITHAALHSKMNQVDVYFFHFPLAHLKIPLLGPPHPHYQRYIVHKTLLWVILS